MVAARAFDILGRDRANILTVTMPCYGTTNRTRGNAEKICEEIGIDTLEAQLLPEDKLYEIFSILAKKGAGIELNMKTLGLSGEEKDILLRPYFIAKDCGCKFYLGSDSHKASALACAKENFEDIITQLDLKESDKFIIRK